MGLMPYKNEVYLDWSDEKNVEAMRAALKDVSSRLDRSYPAIIGGERVETDGEIVSVNPADPSQVVGRTASATEREADMALDTATRAFETWSRTAPEARARILLRASAIMKRRKFELLAWEAYEGGKPWFEADAQVAEAIDFLEYYAREMLRLKDGVERCHRCGEYHHHEALGVHERHRRRGSRNIRGGWPARRRPELPARLRLGGWGLSGRGCKDAFYLLYRLDEEGTQDKRAGGQKDRAS